MLSTAYYGLFRICEIAEMRSGHAALAKDVQITSNKNKFLFVLRSSKTHTKGNTPQFVKLSSNGQVKGCVKQARKNCDTSLCPYELLRHFASSRPPYKTDNEQFFVFSDRSPVAARHLRNCLKQALQSEKFNDKLYTLHSARSGRALDLLKLGLSVETIKKLGRWKSNAVFKYLRQ